jgi:hypothetical protein
MPDEDLDEFTAKKPFLSDAVYNLFKRILTIVFPAFSALYLGLDALWDLPAEDQVVGTCALLATFLGVVLTVSSNRYTSTTDGDMVITQDPETGKLLHAMEFDGDPSTIKDMDMVRFKVKNQV